MFSEIMSFYNKNRKVIITGIIICISVVAVIQILNHFAKSDLEQKNNNIAHVGSSGNGSNSNIKTEAIIEGDKINTITATENQNIISQFINYCNNKDLESAYKIISTDCKKELVPTINDFNTKYYSKIFTEIKQYNIDNWINSDYGYTYKITYSSDTLTSGKISSQIEDYITVIKENGEDKLNILRQIAHVNINKTGSNDYMEIKVIDKNVYDNYEIYNIKISNKTDKIIMLNRDSDNNTIYVKYSSNDVKYTAFMEEIYTENMILKENQSKYLSIKINKLYNGDTNAESIAFEDIINDEKNYQMVSNKENYKDTSSINIKF